MSLGTVTLRGFAQEQDFLSSTPLLMFYEKIMVKFWLRILENLRNMTLNIRK